jgi:uncharacterized protein
MSVEAFLNGNVGSAALNKTRGDWTKVGLIALSALSGASAATITAVSAVVGYKIVKPTRRVLVEETAEPVALFAGQLPRQKVSFKSADGRLNLTGYFYPSPASKAALILCHGFHGGAVDTHKPALYSQATGYNVLTFDFRGCGESEGKTTSIGFYEVEDLLGAVEYVKTRPEVDPQRIAVYGYSMGGAVAIMAAARSTDIKALITDCAFASLDTLLSVNFEYYYRLPDFPFRYTAVWWSTWFSKTVGKTKHIAPVEALKQVTAEGRTLPHLIIHGLNDRGIPVANAHLLYEHAPGPKHLWVVPQAGHVVASEYDPQRYMARINAFLAPLLKA